MSLFNYFSNFCVSTGFSYHSEFYHVHCKTQLGRAVKTHGKGDAIYPANYCIKIKVRTLQWHTIHNPHDSGYLWVWNVQRSFSFLYPSSRELENQMEETWQWGIAPMKIMGTHAMASKCSISMVRYKTDCYEENLVR